MGTNTSLMAYLIYMKKGSLKNFALCLSILVCLHLLDIASLGRCPAWRLCCYFLNATKLLVNPCGDCWTNALSILTMAVINLAWPLICPMFSCFLLLFLFTPTVSRAWNYESCFIVVSQATYSGLKAMYTLNNSGASPVCWLPISLSLSSLSCFLFGC